MRNFKKHPDEDTDGEDSVENVIFQDMTASSEEDEPVENDSGSDESYRVQSEPVAGPSSAGLSSSGPNKTSSDDEGEDGNSVIEAIRFAQRRVNKTPPDITFTDHVTDLSFHPDEDLLAVSSVTGDVFMYRYSTEACTLIETIELHKSSCRAVEFGEDGRFIVSCGKDKSIIVADPVTTNYLQFYDNAHEDPPYSLHIISENIFSSGDEGGTMKVWDIRQKSPVCRFKVGEELISSMVSDDDEKYLVCASCDCITAYDLNSRKFFVQSEPYETELTSMRILRQGTKLVVATIKGSLYLFNWGSFGYHSDFYPGLKENINTTLAVTENILISGYGDGVLRAANLFPHKQLGVVGQHKLSVESIDITHDARFIGSCAFDETVKFWDIEYFEEIHVKAEKAHKRDTQHNLPSSTVRNPGEFFAGLS